MFDKLVFLQSASGSAPSTPPYSHPHSLELESRMIDSTMAQLGGVPQQHATCTVIAGSDGSRHGGPAAVQPPSSSSSRHLKQASSVGAPVGTRRGAKQFVDPCDIAPIKKRRIQVEHTAMHNTQHECLASCNNKMFRVKLNPFLSLSLSARLAGAVESR